MTSDRIRALNDTFRKSFVGGGVVVTRQVASLPLDKQRVLLERVRQFDQFDADHDPHGEHDFGCVELDGEKFFFKIDYYDSSLSMGSEDPSDPKITQRIMTIMRADEY